MHLHVSMLSPGGFDFSEEFLPKIPTLELKIDQISPPRANYTLVKHIWSDVYKPSTKTTAYLQKLSPRSLFFKIQDGRNVISISFPDHALLLATILLLGGACPHPPPTRFLRLCRRIS